MWAESQRVEMSKNDRKCLEEQLSLGEQVGGVSETETDKRGRNAELKMIL